MRIVKAVYEYDLFEKTGNIKDEPKKNKQVALFDPDLIDGCCGL